MGLSSIHIVGVKPSSERHNNREQKLGYVRADLSHLNSKFEVCKIADRMAQVSALCKNLTGRSLQEKAKPIREGVLLLDEHHTAQDLKTLADKLQQRFGIATIQGHVHKDEGHYDKFTREWKPNLHGHMVFDWVDHSTGKTFKLKKEDLVELQTVVAEHLGLERGVQSSKVHLDAIAFKTKKEQEDLEKILGVKNSLAEAQKIIEQGESMKEEVKVLEIENERLENENEVKESNLEYVEKKIKEKTQELNRVEEKLSRNRGFKL